MMITRLLRRMIALGGCSAVVGGCVIIVVLLGEMIGLVERDVGGWCGRANACRVEVILDREFVLLYDNESNFVFWDLLFSFVCGSMM